MANIREVIEIPLDDLVIGKGQVRLSDVGKDIDELATSIAKIGLLEPIVVCPAEKEGKYEILTGQRRYLAHRQLKKDTILSAVIDQHVDETTAKVLSLTENLMRRDLNRRDLITVCTSLYKMYGSVRDVAAETGLPQHRVAQYIKYERLAPELRTLVDEGLDVKVALRAQDAASVTGEFNAEDAVKLAKEMAGMSGAQQAKIIQTREDSPERSVDDVIEGAKSGEKITQIVVTLGNEIHGRLKSYAGDEGTTVDDAARGLIEEGLSGKGYSEED